MYRLVNPWQKNDNVNFNDELNYLVIDASDPDYVMVPAQQSPVADAQEGETWYCSYTDWAVNVVGIDKETFFSLQPDKVPQLRDGVIKFSRNTMAVMYPYGTGAEFEPAHGRIPIWNMKAIWRCRVHPVKTWKTGYR